jgi:hypothetical protein
MVKATGATTPDPVGIGADQLVQAGVDIPEKPFVAMTGTTAGISLPTRWAPGRSGRPAPICSSEPVVERAEPATSLWEDECGSGRSRSGRPAVMISF